MIYKLMSLSFILGLLLLFLPMKTTKNDKINNLFFHLSTTAPFILMFAVPIILKVLDDLIIPLLKYTKENGIAITLLVISLPFGMAIVPLFILVISSRDDNEMTDDLILLLKIAFRGFMILSCLSLIAFEIF